MIAIEPFGVLTSGENLKKYICYVPISYQHQHMYSMHLHIYSYIFNAYAYIFICIHFQMGNKDSAPVLRDEDVAVLCESSGLSEEVEIK